MSSSNEEISRRKKLSELFDDPFQQTKFWRDSNFQQIRSE
jgi:hypothetical protein